MQDGEWSDEQIASLRQLWKEGHSSAEIGRRIKKSKNSVIGKARRLHLPQRPAAVVGGRIYTADEDAIIRQGAEDGLDDDQITALLTDRTRASVQDRRWRMGVNLSDETVYRVRMKGSIASAAKARAKARFRKRDAVVSAPVAPNPRRVVQMKRHFFNDGIPKPPTFPVHTFDLLCEAIRNDERPADGCRWIVNDGGPWMVCAAKRERGESYCGNHLRRAYRATITELEDAA